MEATTNERRWWHFGLKGLFVAMLVVAAYAAAYAQWGEYAEQLEWQADDLREAWGREHKAKKELQAEVERLRSRASKAENSAEAWRELYKGAVPEEVFRPMLREGEQP